MSLPEFIRSLWSEGRVKVPGILEPLEQNDPELSRVLESVDRDARELFPGEAPALSLPAAAWSAHRVHTVCAALAHRDLGVEELKGPLSAPCPAESSPSVCYSVDLTLRYLPDVVRLARAASSNDPLLEPLMAWCREWPLSSVGVADVGPVDISAFAIHDGLLRLYADRIIERRDRARLGDPLVDGALREAIGAHPELAPEVAAWLDAARSPPAGPETPA